MTSADILLNHSIKPSVLRVMIYDYLKSHRTHPTADDIYSHLLKDAPTLSKTTVYNTLKLFVEHALVSMLTIDDTYRCFDGNIEMHAHLMCRNCKKIIDMPMPDEVGSFIKELDAFKADEVQLYVKGICKDCNLE